MTTPSCVRILFSRFSCISNLFYSLHINYCYSLDVLTSRCHRIHLQGHWKCQGHGSQWRCFHGNSSCSWWNAKSIGKICIWAGNHCVGRKVCLHECVCYYAPSATCLSVHLTIHLFGFVISMKLKNQ